MKAIFLWIIIPAALPSTLAAETCREVVRDSSGRIVQTIDRQKQTGGTVQSITRDASGRIIGTFTTRTNSGGSASTQYRDASGRLTGSAATQPSTGGMSSGTTYRDASGRIQGNAATRIGGGSSGTTTTQYRDASGRLAGTATTNGNRTGASTTQRDASGRLTGSSAANGKCQGVVRVPDPPTSVKKIGVAVLRFRLSGENRHMWRFSPLCARRPVGLPVVHLSQLKPCIMSQATHCFSSTTAMACAVSHVGPP